MNEKLFAGPERETVVVFEGVGGLEVKDSVGRHLNDHKHRMLLCNDLKSKLYIIQGKTGIIENSGGVFTDFRF